MHIVLHRPLTGHFIFFLAPMTILCLVCQCNCTHSTFQFLMLLYLYHSWLSCVLWVWVPPCFQTLHQFLLLPPGTQSGSGQLSFYFTFLHYPNILIVLVTGNTFHKIHHGSFYLLSPVLGSYRPLGRSVYSSSGLLLSLRVLVVECSPASVPKSVWQKVYFHISHPSETTWHSSCLFGGDPQPNFSWKLVLLVFPFHAAGLSVRNTHTKK